MIIAYRSRHFLIIAFLVWHMFAVAAYLLPSNDDSPFNAVRRFSVPYVLGLSQWQQWNIFSPNPLQRLSVYRVERRIGDRWETAMIMDFHRLPWYARAKELKVLGRLQDDWKALLPYYLSSLCSRIPGGSGTEVRLYVQTTVLPSDLRALQRTAQTVNVPDERLLVSVHCPQF